MRFMLVFVVYIKLYLRYLRIEIVASVAVPASFSPHEVGAPIHLLSPWELDDRVAEADGVLRVSGS